MELTVDQSWDCSYFSVVRKIFVELNLHVSRLRAVGTDASDVDDDDSRKLGFHCLEDLPYL